MGLIQKTLERLSLDVKLMEEVRNAYNEYGGRGKVAKLLGVSYNSVGHVASALGLQTDRHTRRSILRYYGKVRNPFDGSDFGDYLIGYILGDGSIIYKNGKLQGVCISSSDLDHLEKIRDLWDTNLVIKGPNKGNYVLNCYDASIADYLCCIGFVPAKSKRGMFLDYPISWSLVRGLFDSDGCVSYDRSKNLRVYIYGSHPYIEQIQEFINIEAKHVDRKTFMGLAWYSKANVKQIYQLMYKNHTICLKRKYERFYRKFEY